MNHPARHLYEFGPFRLDATERLLLRDQQHIPLTPKAFETLLVLVEHDGHVIDKDEMMKKVWPDTFVEEVNLAKNVSCLRKILATEHLEHYIETIPKRGYRFVAGGRGVGGGEPPPQGPGNDPLSPLLIAGASKGDVLNTDENRAKGKGEFETYGLPFAPHISR